MAKRHIYKDNWIIEFTPTCFHAFILNVDDEVEDRTFLSLEKLKNGLTKTANKNEEEFSNWQYAAEVPTLQFRSANTLPREMGVFKVGDQ